MSEEQKSQIVYPDVSEIRKAIYEGDTGVTVDKELDKIIGRIVDFQNPIRANVPRIQGTGTGYKCKRRAPGATPAKWVLDTEEGDEGTGSYTEVEFPFRTILARGQVSRKARKQGQALIDLLVEEIESKANEFKNTEEAAMITGNSSDGKTPDGLKYLIPSSQQILANAGVTPGDLTLDLMDQLLDKVKGIPSALFMSKRSRRRLNALLQASQRFLDRTEVKGGFKVLSYNECPIFASSNIVNTQQVDGTGVTSETGGSSSTIYCVSFVEFFVKELTSVQILPLARTSSQFEKFDIFCDEVFPIRDYLTAAKLVGVA